VSGAQPDGDDEPFTDDRELCPDGACIGVLGPDGRCSECRRTAADFSDDELTPEVVGVQDGPRQQRAGEADEDGPALDEERELCPDGSCVGLIGSDRRCKECGRAAE